MKRALADGWSRDAIGHHIVRRNRISHCEQAGIVGSLGCAFSTVAGNTIHDIHVRRRFGRAEMAALKFHGAIDVVIKGNHVFRSEMGIWPDWMAQGARVSGNLLHDNRFGDLHIEVNHGPYVIDNNLFLSPAPSRVYNVSQGGAYVHNLFGGSLLRFVANGKRSTPCHQPHATEIVDIPAVVGGDDRFYNNLFVKTQLLVNYEKPMPSQFAGNVYLGVAKAHWAEERIPSVVPEYDAKAVRLEQKADGWYLALTFDPAWVAARRHSLVTSELLGKAKVPNATSENPDGSPLRVATDYHGKRRDESNPAPGPFENPGGGSLLVKVH